MQCIPDTVVVNLGGVTFEEQRLIKLNRPPLLNSAAWKHLSNLPTLDTLSIFGPSVLGSFALFDKDNLDFASFLDVRTLSFYTRTAADVTTVIQRSEFPSLKKFALHVDNPPSEHTESILRVSSQFKACQTLEHIQISSHGRAFYDHSDISSIAIRHSLCFAHLRHLQHIMSAVNIDIDSKAESFQYTSLRELGLDSSPAKDAEAIARILSLMLPRIGEVMYDSKNHAGVNSQEKTWDILVSGDVLKTVGNKCLKRNDVAEWLTDSEFVKMRNL
ncbi:hypothetical protein K503DRAFT_858558 [Rhizopogon vinicolor AM-OR11-026]|uniref:Uncharacterized protein n=1 Tax=Rhizopogon vinicolor AM-OR11-026 TaxID=1314800 RepID=A0A1B7MSF6_9AGAM|nr:hypothetical protein K503DRAFT_858558 [Rhizopogon vinicolor AM-OR11-026]